MTICDAHFHLVQSGILPECRRFDGCTRFYGCTCAHDRGEFLEQQALIDRIRQTPSSGCCTVLSSFGMHPQLPDTANEQFLESLLEDKRIQVIGEAGFDLFTPEFRLQLELQERAWTIQLAAAARFRVPLIVHCRKALDRLFRDAKKLRAVPSVIFHSFAGSPADAQSLLCHGINGYFSFGKPVINGKKSARACVSELPADRILLETDAPFQTLKGEDRTLPEDIIPVYRAAAGLRSLNVSELAALIETNFQNAFLLTGG
jgi:TatD DNase family protein